MEEACGKIFPVEDQPVKAMCTEESEGLLMALDTCEEDEDSCFYGLTCASFIDNEFLVGQMCMY